MNSDDGNGCSHPLGFPIRTSPDHSLLATSRGFSQLTTSFFAYLRQGIHTHALSSLTIKSTSHTKSQLEPFPPRQGDLIFARPAYRLPPASPAAPFDREADSTFTFRGRRRYFSLRLLVPASGRSEERHDAVYVCPSIFSCQRSRLRQQPAGAGY